MLSGWKTFIVTFVMGAVSMLHAVFPDAQLPTGDQVQSAVDYVGLAIASVWAVVALIVRARTSGPMFGRKSGTSMRSPALIGVLAGLLALLVLTGCTTLRTQPTTSGLVVTYATAKVIEVGETAEARLERAERIKAIAGEARTWLAGEGVTIEFLEAAALARLAKLSLSPADAMLANALVQVAVQELRVKIGAGVIPPDKLVTVNQLLGWIESAAALYGA